MIIQTTCALFCLEASWGQQAGRGPLLPSSGRAGDPVASPVLLEADQGMLGTAWK